MAGIPNWEQNAKDMQQILCDSGDLFRECYDELVRLESTDMARKVQEFCARVNRCMVDGTPWEDTPARGHDQPH